jgi:hypothetical protein
MTSIEQENQPAADRLLRFLGSPLAILLVLAVATVLRAWKLTDWSLWEDEETSIYFSQNPGKPFPRFFPIFFLSLRGLYEVAGVSVAAGRVLSATIGVLSVWLVYAGVRRLISREVALLAALFLAINLGHLFWSQSIRYFILLLVFQMLSMYWFLEGMERGKYGTILLSNLAFAFALLTHFSALLLTPVFIAYLFLVMCGRQSGGAYRLKGYLAFCVPHAIIVGLCIWQIADLHGVLGGMARAWARDPIRLLTRVAGYFGIPLVALGLLAPVMAFKAPKRILLFLVIGSFLPILELAVIARLELANVTWFYGLFALAGLVTLAAATIVSLHERGYTKSAMVSAAAVGVYSILLLVGYYGGMHGDRPRWQEAARFLSGQADVAVGSENNPDIFATVPGVVAFYLGVAPEETMDQSLVKRVPLLPPLRRPTVDQWYVVEGAHASPEYQTWLEKHCTLEATFEAHTGPKDRTIRVYRYPGEPPGLPRR